jgi:hypothetical protein
MLATREQLLAELTTLSARFPDMRFGQLVLAVCKLATSPNEPDFYGVEDADLLKACISLLDFNRTPNRELSQPPEI